MGQPRTYSRHSNLARNDTSRKSVAPIRNRVLVYPDSDEEYCRLPPLLLSFQTPQPSTKFNFVSHNSRKEVDIDNMTLEQGSKRRTIAAL
ncbi:hypothetical protein Tco_0168047 [Tanacetum coccineum]